MKRFRKLTAMLCALCMTCVLAAAISVAPVNASTIGMNIIKDPTVRNSSLTTWNAGWEAYGAIHKFSTESHTDDGSGSISVEHPSGVVTSSHCSTTVELVENAKYRYSVWIKAENIEIITHNGNGGAYIAFDDKYGGSLGGIDRAGSYDWTYYEGYFTPAESGTYKVTCRIWGAYGKAWFDDFCMEMVEEVDSEVLKHWIPEAEVQYPTDDGGFTLVGIGDTQGYSGSGFADRFYGMTEWLAGKKDEYNIQYAMHLGDIVDASDDAFQWNTAVNAMKTLQDGGIKYSLSPGNHDYDGLIGLAGGVYVDRNSTTYNKHFKKADYEAWLGTEAFGTFDDTMDNSWHTFEVGEYKYLILALEYGPRNEVLEWANALCEQHSDRNVIVTTHAYLNGIAELQDDAEAHLKDANGSNEMWNKLVRKHKNIFMVLNGHFVSYGVSTSIVYGDYGNPIIQMKVDPQNLLGGGEPLFALYRITNGTEVATYYYSANQNKYYSGANFKVNLIKGSEESGTIEIYENFRGKLYEYKQLDGKFYTQTWSSSNEKVFKVDQTGKVTAVATGTATLTCRVDSRQSAYADKGCLTVFTAKITVLEYAPKTLSVNYDLTRKTLYAGDEVSTAKGVINDVTVTYTDGTEKTYRGGYTLSLAEGTTLCEGENEITVTRDGVSTTITVTAVAKPVEPSVEPSVEESVEPSVEETVEPTVEPSVEESVEPSVDSTVEEPVEPSVGPTTAPTVAPTETPSVEESVEPTTAPSKEEGKGGSSCGAVAPTNGGNGGGATLLLVALLAVACLLFKKKAA